MAKIKIINWVKTNRDLLLILVIGSILRLYKIDQYMTFLGDEGRDVIVVRRLLVDFDPILIGPGTSIGNMYLGPLYYYFMAPFLLFFKFSPVGPAVGVALLGVAAIYLIYLAGRDWFSEKTGLISAGLYAISPTVIIYSRASWNPNIMPFFALLSIYSLWKVWKEHKFKWLIVLGVSYAFVLQSHYLGLLLAPTLIIFWYFSRVPGRYTLYAAAIFLFLMSPLLIFDIRHNWINTKAVAKFFTERQTTVSAKPWNAIPKLYPIFEKANTSLIAGKNETVGRWTTVGIVVLLGWLILFKKNGLTILHRKSYILLLSWLAFAILGLGLYKQEIYDHYYGFFFPAPFLLVGALAERIGKIRLLLVLGLMFYVNIKENPLKFPPNQQLKRSIEVANKIGQESGGQKFNLAVIAERNYEDGYQYFLEKEDRPVVDIDAQVPETITNQLFVVCEMPKEKCDPTHSPKAEVANFGWTKIDKEWEVFGATIYKLIHTD